MIAVYLWINAVLYALFSVMCFTRVESTSNSLGYVTLNAAGHSEYSVVYGGMQLGLAVFFAYAAYANNDATKIGLLFAIALYVPIIITRWISIAHFSVRAPVTVGVGALETVLGVAAIVLWMTKVR